MPCCSCSAGANDSVMWSAKVVGWPVAVLLFSNRLGFASWAFWGVSAENEACIFVLCNKTPISVIYPLRKCHLKPCVHHAARYFLWLKLVWVSTYRPTLWHPSVVVPDIPVKRTTLNSGKWHHETVYRVTFFFSVAFISRVHYVGPLCCHTIT